MNTDVEKWTRTVSGDSWRWFVKYLAGNDTLLTRSHQAGPYVPKPIAFGFFPSVADPSQENPRVRFEAAVDSHGVNAEPNIIWYNNRLSGQTRNECRITGWGGRRSPIMDPDATGSLCIFAFFQPNPSDAQYCRVWLCRSIPEEEFILDLVGPVEPGGGILYHAGAHDILPAELSGRDSPCRIAPKDMPASWLGEFPQAQTVVEFAVSRQPSTRYDRPDKRLLRRRECEFEIFRSVEEVLVMPRIREGFATVDLFVDFANAVTNRRKSRSGASLELQAKTIFDEEGVTYSHDEVSEGKKRPDFIFPSAEAYRTKAFPASKLQMLGVKTTCKDRWRQILNEANRIKTKHLLTLQEGVSGNQLDEMKDEGVILVVPEKLHSKYPKEYRGWLMSFERFITTTKAKYSGFL